MDICTFLKKLCCKEPECPAEGTNISNPQQSTLMPATIDENEPQYFPVKEIGEKLRTDRQIRNIALTGPYGSGKSSVLCTLQAKYPEFNYLQISLATLEAYDSTKEQVQQVDSVNSDTDKTQDKKRDVEKQNRLIEYSILQQLIYREKYKTLPNSRLKRIFHFGKKKLCLWTCGIFFFFIAAFIAFEPRWLRVDAMYRIFNWGPTANTIFDVISVAYMFLCIFICIRKALQSYCGYHLSKINLKDGEIELKAQEKETSIFNRHLDEIIYFFQSTEYNVVIIEDLDRFNTADIYLKLRELNQLINDSKEIGRHIVFIYAVKDDVFKDTQRAKFFDYISTVIPFINPSNSKDKLKEELRIRGYEDIPNDDLEEIAFFINDMRLLRNIANEYQQYRNRLCSMAQTPLNPTKLLGMIVYKNYYPRDFAQLHNREGKVYRCINSKKKFVAYAQQELGTRKSSLENKIKEHSQYTHLSRTDLRITCAYHIINQMRGIPQSVTIDGKSYSLHSITNKEELFEKMLSNNIIQYQYKDYYSQHNDDLNIEQSGINLESLYWQKKKIITDLPKEIAQEQKNIQTEEIRIKSMKLAQLFSAYDMENCKAFTEIELEPLMNVFLRRGYLDEDYYDYISYFYKNISITQNDRDLLLSMKQAIKKDYQANIDKVENFANQIPLYVFNNDAVLNNILADFLISHSIRKNLNEKYELLMKRIEREDAPLEFIAQYYQNGRHIQHLFSRFISWDIASSWAAIIGHEKPDEKEILIEGWLRFCNPAKLSTEQREWLNENYIFLTEHSGKIGLEQLKQLSKRQLYHTLNTNSHELLDFVIDNSLYAINRENLCLITSYLNKADNVNVENLNLTRIRKTGKEVFYSYIEANLTTCLQLFSREVHDEDEEALLLIINEETIAEDDKKEYLNGQQNKIQDIDKVTDEAKETAIELFLTTPTWENVAAYFTFSGQGVSDSLKLYIEHYDTELGRTICPNTISVKEQLFDVYIASCILEIDSFKKVLHSFDNTIVDSESIPDLNSQRLGILINAGKVQYTEENTSAISSSFNAEDMAKYLEHHKTEYLQDIENIEYTTELALCLLRSTVFSLYDKTQIIPILDLEIIEASSALATEICTILTKTRIDLDKTILTTVIGISDNVSDRVIVATYTIKNNPDNSELVETLLSRLPSPYNEITERDRKRPAFEKADYNIELLATLSSIGYISSYSETENGLKVNKKVSSF